MKKFHADELGGAMTHGSKSGVAHFVAENEYECMDYIKKLLSFIPQNNTQEPPVVKTDDDPNQSRSINSLTLFQKIHYNHMI